ncbi:hypothetical protein [Actinomadura sp. DC4]|uniref:hypothetical protein n=1 Tax=Actinomadura sp. DC4 TaxID=3055069 RepID=UPI0025AF38A2|nr:hypothetical protein [Actinomadura sp. DC4]MDN3352939.1 hypothetical protein [Actinomadura sp. DC4]
MTAPESKDTSKRESDSQKIDAIAEYVRDQRKADKSPWKSLEGLSVYLAIAAFFFGIGTFTDLRKHFLKDPDNLAKVNYVKRMDGYCTGYIATTFPRHVGAVFAAIAADDLDVLSARERMGLAWTTVPIPANMSPKDIGVANSVRSYYVASDNFLQAAIGRARVGDGEGYALDIGLYRQTNAAFIKEASDFGFTACNHLWGVDNVPKLNP